MEYNKPVSSFKNQDIVQGFYLAKEVNFRVGKNNSKFVDLNIADQTGEINAKIWDYNPGDEELYKSGTIVKLRGTVTQWKGQLQFKIEKIRPSIPEDEVKIEDFIQSAPYKSEDMFEELEEFVSRIENKDIFEIVTRIVELKKEKLLYYPAAKTNHHSIRAGLLYHMLTMLKSADALLKIYTYLNPSLLFAGIVLHDICKVDEISADETGVVNDYTTEGKLLSHIIQCITLIDGIGNEIKADKEIITLLSHMVLSHHYEPEYGSPVKPMFPEAELLHYLDIIDARLYDMRKAGSATEKGGFSDKVWSLENRQVYNVPDLED